MQQSSCGSTSHTSCEPIACSAKLGLCLEQKAAAALPSALPQSPAVGAQCEQGMPCSLRSGAARRVSVGSSASALHHFSCPAELWLLTNTLLLAVCVGNCVWRCVTNSYSQNEHYGGVTFSAASFFGLCSMLLKLLEKMLGFWQDSGPFDTVRKPFTALAASPRPINHSEISLESCLF